MIAEHQTGEIKPDLKERVQEATGEAKRRFYEARQAVTDKSKEFYNSTDLYVRNNPWRSMGIAAGVAALLGFLISRRSREPEAHES
jgi:ElaB/YqjD/DUF883 family membrane-anchored ribosome-binding protein